MLEISYALHQSRALWRMPCFQAAWSIQKMARRMSTSVPYTTITMPALSPTMTAGTISSWVKKEGEAVAVGDVLCEIETDKATMAYETQDEGFLAKVVKSAQSGELAVGTPIAYMVEDAAALQAFLKMDLSALVSSAANVTSSAPTSHPAQPVPALSPALKSSNVTLSPAAKHIVHSQHLDVTGVKPSGKGGKLLTKEDLIKAIKAGTATKTAAPIPNASIAVAAPSLAPPAAVAAPPAGIPKAHATSSTTQVLSLAEPVNPHYTDIPNSNMRKIIAKRLTESKAQVPHFYSSIECDIDELLKFRKKLKAETEVNVSVNDLVIKSAALALRDVPEANALWNSTTSEYKLSASIDISVAVATPNGLITPIIKNVDGKGLTAINAMVKDLAGRARDGKLKPEEFQGGTFTISNLGMFGIDEFSAVINPPQACILAVGSGVAKVIPPPGLQGKPKVTTTVTVCLSGDRRVVDNAIAAQYLQAFRFYVSNPRNLVL